MADNVSQTNSAPATSSAPQSSGGSNVSSSPSRSSGNNYSGSNQSSSNNSGIMTPDEIFAEFERKIGLSDDSQMNDFSRAKKYEDKSIEDMYASLENQTQNEQENETQESQDNSEADTQNSEGIEESQETVEPEFKPYTFTGKVGNQDKTIQFNTPEQLNRAIQKAVVAEKVYKDYKALKQNVDTYKEGYEFSQRFDTLVSKEPAKLLNAITEEMGEDALKQWILQKAEYLARPAQEREIERKLAEAEELRQQMEEMKQEREMIKQQRLQSAQEADKHVVKAWGEGLLSKIATRFPEQYHGIFEKELRSTLLEGRHRRSSGETITIKTLDSIFARNVKPIIELIAAKKVDNKTINREVGKAIQSKKQDGLGRVQQAARSMQASNQTKRPAGDVDIGQLFDSLISGAERGQVKMRQ